jgi:hypothetical protein
MARRQLVFLSRVTVAFRSRFARVLWEQALAGESDGTPQLVVKPLEGSHSDVVSQVMWVDKGQGRGERLVSISVDGRITEWSTKKGMSGAGAATCCSWPRPHCLHHSLRSRSLCMCVSTTCSPRGLT